MIIGYVRLTSTVRVVVVWVKPLIQELGHFFHGSTLDVIHEFLQTGLRWKWYRRTRLFIHRLQNKCDKTQSSATDWHIHLSVQFRQLFLIQIRLLVHPGFISKLKREAEIVPFSFIIHIPSITTY